MFKFILRRLLYAVPVLAGVVTVTFLLFNLAAGDPAAAVLGEKARPDEIEKLRTELGADLPLFYGHWCRTESFGSDGRRKFATPGRDTLAVIRTASGEKKEYLLKDSDPELPASLNPPGSRAEFFKYQKNPFNSQLTRAFGEIISFKKSFPYVVFLDFGRSITTREEIKTLLWRGVWPSLALMTPVFLGELFFGILLALAAAAGKDRWPDRVLLLLSVLGMSVSFLVVIIFGQWLLGYYCNLFPVWGWGGVKYLFLPVLLAVACGVGGGVRFYRSVFINELRAGYLRTAAAKGCSGESIFLKHLLRNAAIPVITRSTATLPFLFTGSLLLESFFGIPGLGYAGMEALNNADLQLLKALVIISALLFLIFNLLADILYGICDSRVRMD